MQESTGRRVVAVFLAAFLGACGGDGGTTPSPNPTATPPPPSASCSAGEPVAGTPTLGARLVAAGFQRPLDLQSVTGDSQRIYVVEQGGRIQIVLNGQRQTTPFLDISDRLGSGGERGLLGLAFHPDFSTNRLLYVNYTDRSGNTTIAEFRATSAGPGGPRDRAGAPGGPPALRQPQRRLVGLRQRRLPLHRPR